MESMRIGRLINLLARKQQITTNKLLASYNLSSGEHPIFLAICNNPALSQEKISELCFVDKAFTARVLKDLEKKGLIYRKKDEFDKRVNKVYPTNEALKMVSLVKDKLHECDDELTSVLTKEEKEELRNLLLKLDSSF